MKHLPQIVKAALFVFLLTITITALAGTATTVAIPETGTAPASPPATQANAAERAGLLCDEGIDSILAGKVDAGWAAIQKASELAPDDPAVAATVAALKDYIKVESVSQAQRASEYKSAVDQVQRAMLAQRSLPKLAKGLETKLRDKVKELGEAWREIPQSIPFSETGDERAVKMKETAIKSLAKASAATADAVKIAAQDSGPFGKTFVQLAGNLQTKLTQYEAFWKRVDVADEKARKSSLYEMTAMEDGVADALAGVQTMTDKEPARMALIYARMAKLVTVDSDRMKDQAWYKDLIKDAQVRGKAAMAGAKWGQALSIYSSLADLEDDDVAFKDASKIAGWHARVLSLYGDGKLDLDEEVLPEDLKLDPLKKLEPPKPPTPSTTQPAAEPGEERIDWRELVEGIDAEMVRTAISRLEEKYVTKPDYKKIAKGGLLALKVLAQTPQASHSFPSLADKAKTAAFVADIDRLMRNIQAKDNVDHLELTYAWNSVLDANEKSIELPVSVMAMEFTDGFLQEMDKFSAMIWPRDVAEFQKSTMGKFYGIGIQIAKDKGEPLRVVTPLPGSPAHKAGLKVGDLILTVNGKPTESVPLDKLVNMIMGEKGTKVTLKVERSRVKEPFEVPVIRDEINVQTVKGWRYLPDGSGRYDFMLDPQAKIGYIRLTQFTDPTTKELKRALEGLKSQGVRSIVLDLRDNPGGLLRAAHTVTEQFVSEGVIVSTRGAQQPEQEYVAHNGGSYLDGDLVVLVNKGSASAAEIVSGALKDLKRSITVGERSYGKGSVQEVLGIPRHDAALKLTTARYYLPSGRSLHRENGARIWGVDADVPVNLTPKETKRWLEIRRRTDLFFDQHDLQQDKDLANQYKNDIQLNAAVMVLKVMHLKELEATKDISAAK